jgi:hypothetical protein
MRRFSLTLAVLLMAFACFAQDTPDEGQGTRGPSTRAERDRAVKVTHQLEQNPLAPELRADRDWLFKWIVAVPDITISVCVDPVEGSGQYRYSRELQMQKMFSSATFIIENSAQKHDDLAVETAGVEGALKAYQVILKKSPNAHSAYWDRLLKKQQDGSLHDYVTSYMEQSCGSEQTQT